MPIHRHHPAHPLTQFPAGLRSPPPQHRSGATEPQTTATRDRTRTHIVRNDASHRREAGHFVRWANRHKLTNLQFPTTRWHGPSRAIDTEARWHQARRHLHEDTIKPADKVAGLLLLLYAQTPAAISRLTVEHLDTTDQLRLRLGREPSSCPSPSPSSSAHSPAPAADMPLSVTKASHPGCSPADSPADPSAPTNSHNACARSAFDQPKPAPPRYSASPPNCPPPSSPDCSASTSKLPSSGSTPPQATGQPTPPLQPPCEHLNRQSRATADSAAPETDSDGLNIRLHQCP